MTVSPYTSYGYPGYAAPYYPLVAPMAGYDIIGQATEPAPAPGALDKAKTWLGEETLGVKRGYLLGGAAALAALGIYGYSAGWFGKRRR